MVVVPARCDVTTPDVLIVATAVLLLIHVPALAVSETVVVLPRQIALGPVIGERLIAGKHTLIGTGCVKVHFPVLSQNLTYPTW